MYDEHERRRIRRSAAKQVDATLKRGDLVKPDACEWCGTVPPEPRLLEAHHKTYSKPLDVEWLCRVCHFKADQKDGYDERYEGTKLSPKPVLTPAQRAGIETRRQQRALLLANRELALEATNSYKHPGSRWAFQEGWNDAQRKRPHELAGHYDSVQSRKAFRVGQEAWREYQDKPVGECRCDGGNHYCHEECLPPDEYDLGGEFDTTPETAWALAEGRAYDVP